MGVMDAFNAEDRTQIKFSTLYTLLKEVAISELLMNAVKCDVPHRFIREMATGENEGSEFTFIPNGTIQLHLGKVPVETEEDK